MFLKDIEMTSNHIIAKTTMNMLCNDMSRVAHMCHMSIICFIHLLRCYILSFSLVLKLEYKVWMHFNNLSLMHILKNGQKEEKNANCVRSM